MANHAAIDTGAAEAIERFEALPLRLLDKVLWRVAHDEVTKAYGARPEPQLHRLAPSEFPTLASVSMASATLDTLSAALEWDRAKRDAHRRLAAAEGYRPTDSGLVPVGDASGWTRSAMGGR